ncbi:nitrate- and nitrite sensing domain-containing protein [Streptomyces sp. P3]|uniref:nitrate- and nitrite sensing domain-containing protein n=1 Tax=Streptomyces sp. P3 TaxID=2135430 RepID=UPI0020B13E1F|nr:nitrate- and nitrite sensing domain-containing protein [Streptomyces sp. P3]
MQKTRPRRTGRQTASEGGAERTPVGKGRPTHVRNRLIVAVAVVAAAIAGAGAPSVLAASGRLKDSQDLVTLAEQTQDALALARSLADERDEVTAYVAAGRAKSRAPSTQSSTRVDLQVRELTAETDVSAALRAALAAIPSARQSARTGKSTALQAHQDYSEAIAALHVLADRLAENTPARAGSGAYALAELDTAVQQASATRGLLLAALSVPTRNETDYDPVTGRTSTEKVSSDADAERRDALTAAAQQARLRSDAALADFREGAPEETLASYDSTVTGGDVDTAEAYLASLTDQPRLSDRELDTSVRKLDAALSARVDLMRGAEASLYGHRAEDLARLRDDDVTGLEIRVAVLGALMLLAVAVATGMARSLTRPLSVLRRGSARLVGAENPAAEEPVVFTGRNDEFAQVVRSVNALHEHAAILHERVATLESDRKHLVGQRQRMADAREELRAELGDAAAQLDGLRDSISGTFVNLALRTLGLVERQLAVIEGLEEREQDPDRLATLFKLDHFATVMRRHSENLLVLAGTEHVQQHAGPIPLVDVVRAAVSEIERYERVRISALPPHAHVAGFAADDLSHLLAELMENATSFSPPDLPVEVSGWLLENGEVMLSVQDEGIGITGDRLSRLNARLAEFDPETPYDQEGEDGLGLGLYVVARLAHRHGVRVRLREQKQGGVAAVVVLPAPLLAAAPAAAIPATSPASAATQGFTLPGADAEANSNVLPGRSPSADPLVALAERAVREARPPAEEQAPASAPEPEPASAPEPAHMPTPESLPAPDSTPTPDSTPDPEPGPGPAPEPTSTPTAEPVAHPPAERPAETTMELLLPSPPEAPNPGEESARWDDDDPAPAGPAPAAPATGPAPAAPATGPAPAAPVLPGARRAPDSTPDSTPATDTDLDTETEAEHTRTPDAPEEPVTDKGLPKRTPRITAPAQAPRRRTASVDADALRRRLGGFRRGAEAGYRDVEAEIAERTGQNRVPSPSAEPNAPHRAAREAHAHAEEDTGGTVEEASS